MPRDPADPPASFLSTSDISRKRRLQLLLGVLGFGAALVSLAAEVLSGPWAFVLTVLAGSHPLANFLLETRRPRKRKGPTGLRWLAPAGWKVLAYLRRAAPVLAALILFWLTAPPVLEMTRLSLHGCPSPAELTLVAAPEAAATARDLVREFEAVPGNRRYGCPSTQFYVYEESPEEVGNALRGGWSTEALANLGPRPDLWLPGSARYTSGLTVPGAKPESAVAGHSPVIVGWPSPHKLDYPLRQGQTWEVLWREIRASRLPVVRPNPTLSPAAELATVALFASGKGQPARLAEGQAPQLADRTTARDMENLLSDWEHPPGDTVGLLCQQRNLPSARTAVIMTEQQLVRFNAGLSLGGGCTSPAQPQQQFFGIYPSDTLTIQFPVLVVGWQDSARDVADRAKAFQRWLATEAGGRAAAQAGLRRQGKPIGGIVSQVNGANDIHVPDAGQPSAEAFAAVAALWRDASRATQVRLLLDASGSMGDPLGDQPLTRFQIAVQGIQEALGRIGPRDEVGLWVVQSGRPVAAAVAPGPRRAEVAAALAGVQPAGGTPLYQAMVAAAAGAPRTDRERQTAMVILTDGGASNAGSVTAEQMLAAVQASGIKVFVVAIGAASCGAGAITEVIALSNGVCHQADAAGLSAQLTEIFDLLWGGV